MIMMSETHLLRGVLAQTGRERRKPNSGIIILLDLLLLERYPRKPRYEKTTTRDVCVCVTKYSMIL